MTFEETKLLVNEYGYEVHMTGGDRKWLSAIMEWEHTKQLIALEVQIKDNGGHAFKFSHVLQNGIVLSTGYLSPLNNEIHFFKWQRRFMETLERIS